MRDKGNLRTRGPHGLDSIVVGYYRGKELVYVARVRNGFVPASRRQLFEAEARGVFPRFFGCRFLCVDAVSWTSETKWRVSTIRFDGVIDGLRVLCLLVSIALSSLGKAQVPVFVVTPEDSSIKFSVRASVAIGGTFDKWNATLTFTSLDVTKAVLDVKIQADSVNTGSGMEDGKLKGKDFFDVKQSPLITFLSKKVVQTGPDTFDVLGD